MELELTKEQLKNLEIIEATMGNNTKGHRLSGIFAEIKHNETSRHRFKIDENYKKISKKEVRYRYDSLMVKTFKKLKKVSA